MWEKFTMRLGKFVQDILNIFKKKDKTQEWDCVTFSVGEGSCDELHFGPGKVTIMPLTQSYEAELPVQITWDEPKSYVGKKPNLFSDLSDEEYEELKNLISIYLTDLPKRHWVKTLIVSCYASFDYDSIGVDISQLEETGMAHYWCTSTKPMATWDQELADRGVYEEPMGLGDEEEHIIIKDAVLLEWPNSYWTWEVGEDEG